MARPTATNPTQSAPAGRANLTDTAYELIRRRIADGTFEPGSCISERMLSEQLGLGMAPIRSALRRLAAEGFVTIASRRGCFVAHRSIQDVADLFEVRLVLERLVVSRITGHLQADQLQSLQECLKEHEKLIRQGADPSKTLVPDFAFHRKLAEYQGNKFLRVVLTNILDLVFPEIFIAHRKCPDRVEKALEEHKRLLGAIANSDAAEAERLLVKHLMSCREFVFFRNISGLERTGLA